MHYTTRRAAPGAARGGLHKSPTIRSGESGAAGALGVNLNLISPRFRRHPLHRRSGFLRVPCLVLLGAEVPRAERMRTQSQKRSMHSNVSGVAHSPASNAHACKLGLDEAHERLHGRVGLQRRVGPIEGYTPASRIVFPRSSDACCGPRPEWWTHPPGRAPAGHGHPERVVGELGRHAGRRRPADDHPEPDSHHDRQVEPPPTRAHVGDVGEPRPVRAVRGEVAPHQAGRRVGMRRGPLRPALRPLGAPPPRPSRPSRSRA